MAHVGRATGDVIITDNLIICYHQNLPITQNYN